MPDIILYNSPPSGSCYKVRLLASFLGLELSLVNIDALHGETRTETFRQINPLQQIPVLVDGDVKVQDSQAILVYLALKYGPGWIDPSPEGMAAIAEWLSYAAKEVSNGCQKARSFFREPGAGIDFDAAQAVGRKVLAHLDVWLEQRDWLCLGRPTIADIAVLPYVALSREGRLPLDAHPNVLRWIDRIVAQPGYCSMPGLPPSA